MTLVTPVPPAHAADDVDIIRRIGRGDRGALEQLYDDNAGWLTVRLSRRCGNPELVDTALQDTFLTIWKKASRYQPTGDVGAWIWTIAIRRLIDQLRKHPPPSPTAAIAPLADVIDQEVPLALGHTELGEAFASLDPELQAVLAATALDGLTNSEAADLLGIPTGTVKSRLSRARLMLKEQLR